MVIDAVLPGNLKIQRSCVFVIFGIYINIFDAIIQLYENSKASEQLTTVQMIDINIMR